MFLFQDKVHKKTSKINDDDDPLGKDLDNDGIIDRYDNDFRDSDYFESTYDVEDNLHHKVENTNSFSKSQKAQKRNYKRKNYTESLYTREKDDVLKENKPEDKKTGKNTASKKVHSSIYKKQKTGSPGFAPFQSAKSIGSSFRSSASFRTPTRMSSRRRPDNFP